MLGKILIVDDDINICQLLNLYLKKEGFATCIANNGADALKQIRADSFDLAVLDIMMPVLDGMETLKELRTFSDLPVIMLSAKGESMDKISGLESGADDYVTKPFEPQELISRINAVLRRSSKNLGEGTDITIGSLFISLTNYTVKVGGIKTEMPPKEIELLYFLATNPLKVFNREQLLEHVWGTDYKGDSRTVDVHIKRIREKIGEGRNWRLNTVWGVGYKFEVD